MGQRETAAEIDEAAISWAVRLDRGSLTSEEDAALNDWLAQDVRRQGAFAKARAVMVYADRAKALGPAFDPGDFQSLDGEIVGRTFREPTRRMAMMASGTLAASVVVAGAGGLALWSRSPRFATKRGEIRLVPLADGSSMTLNTASEVAVRYSNTGRDLRLIDGEALFDVAKNSARPFVVDAGDVRVRAVGTSFIVRKLSGHSAKVLVQEGVVEVTRATPSNSVQSVQPFRLSANEQTFVQPMDPIVRDRVGADAVTRALAWREGMIAFEGTSLASAVNEFQRYADPRIIVDDPDVGNETITGLFAADNPGGFAKSVAISLGLNARAEDGVIHLGR